MKKYVLLIILIITSFSAYSEPLKKGKFEIGGVPVEVWGHYNIKHMLFPGETWVFNVIVVPADTRQGDLIDIAKEFYRKYPKTRARFFSDTLHIKQYVERDIYMNDKTGKAKKVEFPDSKWVQNHLLGNINNRSKKYNRAWMLEDRYGNRIELLK